ncbi:DNA phosphorothioation-dependent restriction protein DptH [Pseudoalteromonas xiamenensis]|uniref:DNA phosphorothioation-dependent restriction protein DptH n=1 Tax=Pseudoalteromonas xiamenensis TaxID=882626 RepID=UPI0035E720C3
MSEKQYEDFLVEHFCNWAATGLEDESRFQFRSSDLENSIALYSALLRAANAKVNITTDSQETHVFDAIQFNQKFLIPILHGDTAQGLSDNFIAHLRDLVSVPNGAYSNCVLLVIHNSYLDTLLNSARDLGKKGEVWYPQKIKQSLSDLIEQEDNSDKVTQCLLEHRFKQIVQDGATMFGFKELFVALDDGVIQFSELGLLPDRSITTIDNSGQIDKRLSQNHALFEQLVEIVERYPHELVDKLGDLDLSEKFVKEHFIDGKDWKDLDYGDIVKERNTNKENLLTFENEVAQDVTLYPRENKKERHLIIEVPIDQKSFKFESSFTGGRIELNQLKIQHLKSIDTVSLSVNNRSAKRSVVEVHGTFDGAPLFFGIDFKREKPQERFKYRILVVPKGHFLLDEIKDAFLIKTREKRVLLQTNSGTLKIAEAGAVHPITSNDQLINVAAAGIVDFAKFTNEIDILLFSVVSNALELTFEVDGAVSTESLTLPLVLDTNQYYRLYKDEYFGLYNRVKEKVVIEGKDYAPKGVAKELLRLEAVLCDKKLIATQIKHKPEIALADLARPFPELFEAYHALFEYLDSRKALVSTISWGPVFVNLAKEVVNHYTTAVNALAEKEMLSPDSQLLVNLGIAELNGEVYLSPLHPLTLAYFVELVAKASDENDQSFATLPTATLKRLCADGLLPFVWNFGGDFAYNQAVPENRLWSKLVPNKETNHYYVRTLVKQKVSEFVKAFSVLFDQGKRQTVYINSIHNGDNHTLFLGLVDYLKRLAPDSANHIHVNIYNTTLSKTRFDAFADAASYDELKDIAELGADKDKADAIADLIKNRITYSKFKTAGMQNSFNYAHLSFVRNDTDVEGISVDVLAEKSGVASHGMLAGETAYQEHDNYITTYGLKNVSVSQSPALQLSSRFNSMAKAAWQGHKYEPTNGLALKVSSQLNALLTDVYDSSVWTVIIDPKVTLEFFKTQKDTVLIHYSDNFTNSANYDAITVTKRRDIYDQVLSQGTKGLIDEFNAFNGEWLLKLVTCSDNERKEKKSIIGAYKYVNCLLFNSDITWVPLSVAEMLRVAGNVGLKMSESDFSRFSQGYKSGKISDDVLFVGFKGEHLFLLPLEVKIGQKQKHNKGIEQAKELKRYLVETLFGRNDFAGNLYRGLFIRQLLMQIDKFELYQVYPEGYFDHIQAKREWWLQGDYTIADLDDYPQGFMMAFFENADYAKEEFKTEDGILQILLPSGYLTHFIQTPMQTLLATASSDTLCNIPGKYLLGADKPVVVNPPAEENELEEVETHDDVETVELRQVAEPQPVIAPPATTEQKEHLKVLVGHVVNTNEPVYWEPTNTAKFMNTNSGIIGTMGTGKTQCTKSVITQLYRNQHNNVDGKAIGILIFDYKSDYVDDKFINATNGKKFNLHRLPYNPLSLFGDTPMLPVHTARGFSETMGKAFNLGTKQQLKLRKLIGEAYELAGIHKSDKSTWQKAAPTMADIWALFLDSDPAEDSLYAALESVCELEVFEDENNKCTSLYDLVDGITVIELAGYPGEVQNLVVALTLDLFYSQMQKQGKPNVQGDFRQVTKLVLVDEADNFMSQNFASLRKILKEGREYGVGVILSTQDITHFKTGENDYSAYILSWIVHRVAQIKNQDIKGIFNVDDKSEQELLMKNIRELEKHTSLYINGEKQIKRIKDKAFWEL